MIYLFQRVVQNHFQWTRPSPGRLGPSGEGEYVKSNGYGFEDWNFNKNLLIDGYIYGYLPYQPTETKRGEIFKIAFSTYTNQQWYLVGFYIDCKFVNEPPVDIDVVNQKIRDLQQLGTSLGHRYRQLRKRHLVAKVKDDAQLLKWRVSPDNMVRTNQPTPIPETVFQPRTYQITRPTELSQDEFDDLYSLAENDVSIDFSDDDEFPEGREAEKKHKARERNQALTKKAKDLFKRKHDHLYCQICGFDFNRIYGEIGVDFIEAHHTVPISKGERKTKIEDIAMVCANCHKMLHRKRPWLEMEQLKNLINRHA